MNQIIRASAITSKISIWFLIRLTELTLHVSWQKCAIESFSNTLSVINLILMNARSKVSPRFVSEIISWSFCNGIQKGCQDLVIYYQLNLISHPDDEPLLISRQVSHCWLIKNFEVFKLLDCWSIKDGTVNSVWLTKVMSHWHWSMMMIKANESSTTKIFFRVRWQGTNFRTAGSQKSYKAPGVVPKTTWLQL